MADGGYDPTPQSSIPSQSPIQLESLRPEVTNDATKKNQVLNPPSIESVQSPVPLSSRKDLHNLAMIHGSSYRTSSTDKSALCRIGPWMSSASSPSTQPASCMFIDSFLASGTTSGVSPDAFAVSSCGVVQRSRSILLGPIVRPGARTRDVGVDGAQRRVARS